MPHLTRRALLASTAAVLAAPRLSFAAAATPPVAPVRPVTEILWGEKVTDRYRWMESESPEWQAYVHAQGAYTAQALAKIPGRDALAAAISRNTSQLVSVISIQTGGDKIFAEIRPAGAALSQLFVPTACSSTPPPSPPPPATPRWTGGRPRRTAAMSYSAFPPAVPSNPPCAYWSRTPAPCCPRA